MIVIVILRQACECMSFMIRLSTVWMMMKECCEEESHMRSEVFICSNVHDCDRISQQSQRS